MEFVFILKKLLMSEEYNYTQEEAGKLIDNNSDLVMQGIMSGNINATAMALQHSLKIQKRSKS